MAIFKCKMCGGTLEVTENNNVMTCEYCGTRQTLPKLNDDRRTNLYDRAGHFRRNNEYDKAMAIYETILNDDSTDAESYWSIVLCKYGVEYVEDPVTHRRVPTCNRTQLTSILADENYKQALEHALGIARSIYEEEAQAIDAIQKGILEISHREEPFDVFICYKETGNDGRRTPDSVLAQELYHQLTQEGFKVFFSRITLEDKIGAAYEPYIFAALNSSKVMVVIGTKPEHFNAVWVKNEWSRYLNLIKSGAKNTLIPAYRDMDPYDLPDEFSHLQAQDMGKLGFMQDLIRGIKKILNVDKPAEVKPTAVPETISQTGFSAGADALLKRAFMFLEDGDWKQADEYCERVLDIDPENARGYLGKLCAELKINKEEDLANYNKPFDNMPNYQKVLRFVDANYRAKLIEYNKIIQKRIEEEERQEQERIHKEQEQERIRKEQEQERMRKEQEYRVEQKRIKQEQNRRYSGFISVGNNHIVGLKRDGTVVSAGNFDDGKCNTNDWCDIITISAGYYHTAGLKADGTVVAVGYGKGDTISWHDIIAVSAGREYTVGLKSNGTVIAAGRNNEGQCDTTNWRDIITVSAGREHTVGLKDDGTVVAVGYNEYGQCDTTNWRDIIAVSAGNEYTVGLKEDGTVVAVGRNKEGQCHINNWRDITAISAGYEHTIGLKSNGTVIMTGYDDYGKYDVSNWRDIVAVSAGHEYIVGLKTDGTVSEVGYNKRVTINWNNIGFVDKEKIKEQAYNRIEQSKKWKQQGLCKYCGGQIGGLFTKKCKSCGKEI